MTAQQMWDQFSQKENIDAEYEAWAFGDDADALAQLVLVGIKTATSSAYPLYAACGEPLPKENQYSVILDSRGEAVCIVKTEKVCVVPFACVGQNHAAKEGEGDRSLDDWRKTHEAFFTREMNVAGLTFDFSMDVVCEEFKKVYP